MQRSSESIGAIAGALAKAQIELANPEKSLIATIRSYRPGDKVTVTFVHGGQTKTAELTLDSDQASSNS